MAEFIIAKHRNGSVEDVKMRFIKEQAKFTNWDQINTGGGAFSSGGQMYDTFDSEPYNASSMSSLQNASSNEFAISNVSPSPMPLKDEVPF